MLKRSFCQYLNKVLMKNKSLTRIYNFSLSDPEIYLSPFLGKDAR